MNTMTFAEQVADIQKLWGILILRPRVPSVQTIAGWIKRFSRQDVERAMLAVHHLFRAQFFDPEHAYRVVSSELVSWQTKTRVEQRMKAQKSSQSRSDRNSEPGDL
jgi:hypothetical protein